MSLSADLQQAGVRRLRLRIGNWDVEVLGKEIRKARFVFGVLSEPGDEARGNVIEFSAVHSSD